MYTQNLPFNPVTNYQIGFQDAASPVAEGISAFHNDLIILVRFILRFVLYIRAYVLINFEQNVKGIVTTNVQNVGYWTNNRLTHETVLEIIWTIIPAIILVQIAIPSFTLLYSVDEIIEPLFSFKIVGHQWYWSYEFMDAPSIMAVYSDLNLDLDVSNGFDSYLLSDDDLRANTGLTSKRLLTVDNHLFLPARMSMRARVTSADVLHSWAVPSLGVKLDACPGRLNQTSLFIKRKGIYYGQCSELCGVNHGFMPIGIACQDFAGFNNLRYTSFIDYEAFINVQE